MADKKIKIPEAVSFIMERLQSRGYKSYMVGGCVRDIAMGRAPHDYDLCTSATPDEIIASFPRKQIIAPGIDYGTVTVIVDREPYEITTFRRDGQYTDGRRPDHVLFTDNILEDLKRRDFTVNAMAFSVYPKKELIDPYNGMKDIKNKVIRCVGCAEDRFKEDALRILRALRFASNFGFAIDHETAEQIRKQHRLLENISEERIQKELYGMIAGKNFTKVLADYKEVFSFIIPEIEPMIGFKQNNPYHVYDVFEHTLHAMDACGTDDPVVKLALLFHDIGKPASYSVGENGIGHFTGHGKVSTRIADDVMQRLKFDNKTREAVVQLVREHDTPIRAEKKYLNRMLNKMGEEQLTRLLAVRRADISAQNPIYIQNRMDAVDKAETLLYEIFSKEHCFSMKDLAVNGRDIINAFSIKPGPEVGSLLKEMLDKVMDEELPNRKEELLNWAEKQLSMQMEAEEQER